MDDNRYWHFCPMGHDGNPRLGNRDDRLVVVGETLTVQGPPALCFRGLHASGSLLAAARYMHPPSFLCLVSLGGEVVHGEDKSAATERTVIDMLSVRETSDLVFSFERWCARMALCLWPAPPEVHRFLETGDPMLRPIAADMSHRAFELAKLYIEADAIRASVLASRAERSDKIVEVVLTTARALAHSATKAVLWPERGYVPVPEIYSAAKAGMHSEQANAYDGAYAEARRAADALLDARFQEMAFDAFGAKGGQQ